MLSRIIQIAFGFDYDQDIIHFMVKKQIIILNHNGGRLGNQLILYSSIYAYCLEKNFDLVNYSFYEYDKFFNLPKPKLFSALFGFIGGLSFYKSHAITYIFYNTLAKTIPFFWKGGLLKEDLDGVFYLPPTNTNSKTHQGIIKNIEFSQYKRVYTQGWNFRNPVGIDKYHKQISTFLTPKKELMEKVESFISNKRRGGKKLIGVHIRQGDYKVFLGGSLYFSPKEVSEILMYFIKVRRIDRTKTRFVIFSDGDIDLGVFRGIDVTKGPGHVIKDLFALSMCDAIIGSNSTYGAFASYYGRKPLYFFDRDKKIVRQNQIF